LLEWKGLYIQAQKEFDFEHYSYARVLVDSFLQLRLEENILVTRGIVLSSSLYIHKRDYLKAESLLDSLFISKGKLASASSSFSKKLIKIAQGELFSETKRYEEALDAYRNARRYTNNRNELGEVLLREASLHIELEQYEEAKKDVEEAYAQLTTENKTDRVAPYLRPLMDNGYPVVLEKHDEDLANKNGKKFKSAKVLTFLVLIILLIVGFLRREEIKGKLLASGLMKSQSGVEEKKGHANSESPTQEGNDLEKLVKEPVEREYASSQEYIELLQEQQDDIYQFSKGREKDRVEIKGSHISFITNSERTREPVIYLSDGDKIELKQKPSLKKIGETEVHAPLFYKASREYILNITQIDPERVSEEEADHTFYMKNGEKVKLPESRWRDFKVFYSNHIGFAGAFDGRKP
jgi:tetratricopeptide (TPR) repeat protein